MALTTAGKNAALDGILDGGSIQISIHTANPTDAGTANEVSGGTYARQTATFSAASGGTKAMSGTETFDIPGGVTITHYAIWVGSTCVDTGALQNNESYGGNGTYELTGVTITAS